MNKKRKIIVANWKMNPSSFKEAKILFSKITKEISTPKTEIVICPPYLYLENLSKLSKKFILGAQNCSSQGSGAFTGEISAEMLANLGVKYVILGHSERRRMGETDAFINKKIKNALFFGLKPIVCVGENERDEKHEYFEVIKKQIKECLDGINKELLTKIIIAYEPVWAISTTLGRKDATLSDVGEMSLYIKKILTDKFGVKTKMPRIIYGGSVNEKNAGDFLKEPGIDGCMPGAASLNPEKFLKVIETAENLT